MGSDRQTDRQTDRHTCTHADRSTTQSNNDDGDSVVFEACSSLLQLESISCTQLNIVSYRIPRCAIYVCFDTGTITQWRKLSTRTHFVKYFNQVRNRRNVGIHVNASVCTSRECTMHLYRLFG